MTVTFQNLAALINMGVGLSCIDPREGPLAGVRLEDSFACLPLALDRFGSVAFGRELLDAAQELYRLKPPAPTPIGSRLESDFPRIHYLTSFADCWTGGSRSPLRTRLLWTREERNYSAQDGIQHGDTFHLVVTEDGFGPRTMSLGKGYRGFHNELAQFRQISAAAPWRPEDEMSELIVGGGVREFWRALFPQDAEASLKAFSKTERFPHEALLIAAALYMEEPDLYARGFEIRTRGETHPIHIDDRGRPHVSGMFYAELASLKAFSVSSVRGTAINGVRKKGIEIQWEDSLLYVQERRTNGEAGLVNPFMVKAVQSAKASIDREMEEFEDSSPDVKKAYLEREKSLRGAGNGHLI